MQPVEMEFDTIKGFFDHMKKKPRTCDGLALEVLIRNLVNEEVHATRMRQRTDHDELQK